MSVKKTVWVLTTTNDRMPLGEKTTVSLHLSLRSAQREMLTDMKEEIALRGLSDSDVDYENDILYAQTNDLQYSWLIERKEI